MEHPASLAILIILLSQPLIFDAPFSQLDLHEIITSESPFTLRLERCKGTDCRKFSNNAGHSIAKSTLIGFE